MISRRKDYSKKEPSKDARKIYIVCEGKGTEPDYFRFFEGLSSNLEVIIIPPHDGETDPIKLMALAKERFLEDNSQYILDYKDHDTVWFAIDTDTWNEEGKIGPLRDFCLMQNKRISNDYSEIKTYSAWNVVQSNPCFEIWLYYHHYQEKPISEEVIQFTSMKEFVNRKVSGGFNHQRDQIRLPEAILNSKKNFAKDIEGFPAEFSTEQHNLGTEILKFVCNEIQKLRNKM